MLPWILPFALYMGFLAIASALTWLSAWMAWGEAWNTMAQLWLYPIKTLVVSGALVWGWSCYTELHKPVFANTRDAIISLGGGILVYLAWVRMDWPWAMQGAMPEGYNPFAAGQGTGMLLAGIRLFGAAIVVPLMEELFWRSFLIRWIINNAFTSVAIGTFTPLSCGIVVVLFGLEHHLWLAGMMAGLAYNAVLYATRSLWSCVIAHAVTNFLLGLHVLLTHEWQWW